MARHLLALLAFACRLLSADLSQLDPTFLPLETDPNRLTFVSDLVVQPDARILVARGFEVNPNPSLPYLFRLNPDGSLNKTFRDQSGADRGIMKIALDRDGTILVAGFSGTPQPIGPEPQNRLVRLNPDGSLNSTFQLAREQIEDRIEAMSLTSRGMVIGVYSLSGGMQFYRFRANGEIDPTFVPTGPFNFAFVRQIEEQADGSLLICENTPPGLLRLTSTGQIDSNFTPEIADTSGVNAIAVQSDGRILVASNNYDIYRLLPNGRRDQSFLRIESRYAAVTALALLPNDSFYAAGGILARFFRDGERDYTFDPVLDIYQPAYGSRLAVQPDGKLLVGDIILSLRTNRVFVARFDSQLSTTNHLIYFDTPQLWTRFESAKVDTLENAGHVAVRVVRSGNVQDSVALRFSTRNETPAADQVYEPQVGTLTFAPGEHDKEINIALRDNDIIGDNHAFVINLESAAADVIIYKPACTVSIWDDEYAKQPPQFIAPKSPFKISEDDKTIFFSLQTAYAEKLPFRAEIAVRYHVVSGSATIGEDLPAQTGVAKFFYEHGSWRPYPASIEIYDDAKFEGDEQFYIFLTEPPEGFVITTNPVATVIIHDNDAPDRTALGANDSVLALAPLPDGKVIAGGQFNSIDGVQRRGVARLYGDGGIDRSFDPGSGCDGSVSSIVVQPDGRILLGGTFTNVGGLPRNHLARLFPNGAVDATFNSPFIDPFQYVKIRAVALQQDGKLLVSGDFEIAGTPSLRGFVRLHPDGSIDPTFTPPTTLTVVSAIVVRDDGLIYTGGWQPATLTRLLPNGTIDQSFRFERNDLVVTSLALTENGTLYAALNGVGVVRVFNNGRIDSAYIGSVDRPEIIEIMPTGRVLAANGSSLFLLGPNGGYLPSVLVQDGAISCLAIEPNGEILVGGTIRVLNRQPRRRIAHLTGFPALAQAARFESLTFSPDGKPVLQLRGFTTTNRLLERSFDLTRWHAIKLLTNFDSSISILDQSPSQNSAFYRLR